MLKIIYSKRLKFFNEEYTNNYLFTPKSFLENSYQVFLRDLTFERLKNNTEDLLRDLQDIFKTNEDFNSLVEFLSNFFSIVNFNDRKIAKRGGVNEFINGNGAGFDKYLELNSYKPFYNRNFSKVLRWAKWRNDGIKEMHGDSCPFCTHQFDKNKIDNENKFIGRVFKKSALSFASNILKFLETGVEKEYINYNSIDFFKDYVGDENKSSELHYELTNLAIETNYLYEKTKKMKLFNPMNISEEQIKEIEDSLEDMVIDTRHLSKFYSTEFIKTLILDINDRIENLKIKAKNIENLFIKCQERMNNLILERREDINEFLAIAGFPYKFVLQSNGENNALSYLVPLGQENKKVEELDKHLSWGEKNAFSLVMFMFETISEESDLIILDDPITSFDKNKKFAVMKRLFDNCEFSFKNKTVLMLTHDLQPIIDCIHGKFLRRYDIHTPVNARYLINDCGKLSEEIIEEDDLMNVVELTEKLSKDESQNIVVRLINLRKYIELTNMNYNNFCAYDVISNIIHGRDRDNYKMNIANEVSKDKIIEEGLEYIEDFINGYNYEGFINETSDGKLKDILSCSNQYTRVVAARFLFEKEINNENLLKKLKEEKPSLCKFINETNHIENDYIFQLNPEKFFEIPEFYLKQLKEFINKNILIS